MDGVDCRLLSWLVGGVARVAAVVLGLAGVAEMARASDVVDLSGRWFFALDPEDRGVEEGWASGGVLSDTVTLPGSLQAQGFGERPSREASWTTGIAGGLLGDERLAQYTGADDFTSPFWLTPKRVYVGPAWYSRTIEIPEAWGDRRIELVLERPHWGTTVYLNGERVGVQQDAIGTPHVHDLTEAVRSAGGAGAYTLTVRVDNRLIVPIGLDAHAVSDQTQSNWNGIVGEIALRSTPLVWIDSVQVFPDVDGRRIEAVVTIGNETRRGGSGEAGFAVSARSGRPFEVAEQVREVSWSGDGMTEVRVSLELGSSVPLWTEFEPNVLELRARLGGHEVVVPFGMREITIERNEHGSFFAINGEPVFMRGTIDCAAYAQTGYPPTDKASWLGVLRTVKSYGLNHVRFHSWCPPGAAFEAADELGIYLLPECSTWPNFRDAPGLPAWLEAEGDRMLRHYGNHPSFVLMGVGNEFWDGGKLNDEAPMVEPTIDRWRERDPRRYYTTGAGWPQAPANDFHITQDARLQLYPGLRLTDPPRTDLDYREYVSGQDRPILTHEIGQWCAYPDLATPVDGQAVLRARYNEMYRDHLERAGLGHLSEAFTEASGKFQTLLYKAEIEAAIRTRGLGGFQLLGLQDFPGQGVAPVGVLDHLWRSKGYCGPADYRRFCDDRVLLARLPSRVFEGGDSFEVGFELANYGASDTAGVMDWEVRGGGSGVIDRGSVHVDAPRGGVTEIAVVSVRLPAAAAGERVSVRASLRGTAIENEWSVWSFPASAGSDDGAGGVTVVRSVDGGIAERLAAGETVVVLAPPAWIDGDTFGSFRPIFWNTVLFSSQREHTTGALIDADHPALAGFPTEMHADWQWWDVLVNSKPVVLDGLSAALKPIVRPIDDWVDPRSLGLIFEARVGEGRMLVCAADLESDLERRPVARALRRSLLAYAASEAFDPRQRIEAWEVVRLFREPSAMQRLNASVTASSSQAGYGPELIFDGDPSTFWHTAWSPSRVEPPHSLRIDLGRPRSVSGLHYTPRADGPNGRFGRYRVEVSEGGYNWTEVAAGEWSGGADVQTARWSPGVVRYVRLTMVESANGQPFASAAEVEIVVE